eukprot:2879477-Rhodomonas_salina.2
MRLDLKAGLLQVSDMVVVAKKHIQQLVQQHPRDFAQRGVILLGHSMGGETRPDMRCTRNPC